MNVFKSWTVWGAVIVAAAKVIQDPTPTGVAEAIGIVTTAIGARRAIAKNGAGQ